MKCSRKPGRTARIEAAVILRISAVDQAMRVAVFGATGKAGGRVFRKAVDRGWKCRVLVRDRGKLASQPEVDIVEGDARSYADVVATVDGADAVFCCLGLPDISKPSSDFSDSVKTIIRVMQDRGVERILAIAAAGVLPHPTGGYRNKEGQPAYFEHISREHVRNYESLRDSGLRWTLMCPLTLVEGIEAGHSKIAFENLPAGSNETGYDDLAQAMIDLVDNPDSVEKRVGIVSLGEHSL